MYRESKKYLAILPAITLILVLFWSGLFHGLMQSFGLFRIVGESKFTFDIYKDILKSEWFISSFLFTLKIAIFSTVISVLIASVVLYLLFILDSHKEYKKLRILKIIFTSPMLMPYLISAYLISIFFMRSGWLSSLAYSFGIIDKINDFPVLTNEKRGISVIITYVWKTSPFIVLMAYPVMQRIEGKWLELAKIFGAKKTRFFIEIVYPLMLPSIFTSIFIIFAFVFSAFEVPYLLGVTYPKSLAVLSYEIYSKGDLDMRPYAMVINVFITLISFIFGIIIYIINKKYISKKQRGWI